VMAGKKILIVSHEMAPYTELTPQSQYVRELALNLQKKGAEIRVFMPKFGPIKERKHRLHEVIRLSGLNITVGRENNPMIIKVASLQTAKIQVYFLDNEEFFTRKSFFYDDQNKFYKDNDSRMIFFCRGVMDLVVKLGWKPDILLVQGWMSSLVPYYVRNQYKNDPAVRDVKLIFCTYDDGINANLGQNFNQKAFIKTIDEGLDFVKKPDVQELYKFGAQYSDHLVISSPNSNPEMKKYLSGQGKDFLDINDHTPEQYYAQFFKLTGL
jgi:starch synthase